MREGSFSSDAVRAASASSTISSSSAAQELSDRVIQTAKSTRLGNAAASIKSSSLAQLRLSNMKLHGREEDMKLLRCKLQELKKGVGKSKKVLPKIVLVSGVSGTGKSALVKKGLKEPAEKMGLSFSGGKFDLNNSALPLSAFIEAMGKLIKKVMAGDKAEEIMAGVVHTFNQDDIKVLAYALPGCETFFNSATVQDKSKRQSFYGKETVLRLQFAIRRLLKIICASLNGVVLFFDDLQWADTTTLDLLKSISLDADIPSLLMAGAYREDEVTESHHLALNLREMKQMSLTMTEIKTGNLLPKNVNSLVAEALGMEDDEGAVETLAMTVHKKTDGNAFFVLIFLRSLYDEELIQFNFGLMKWTIDDDAIKAKLMTANVATVLVNKLKRFEDSAQNILKVAAVLGAKFHASVVATVVDNVSQNELRRLSSSVKEMASSITDDTTTCTFDASIHEFEEEGLLERETDDIWVFGHDQIQSAALKLIPPEKQDGFRGEIGNVLQEQLDPEDLDNSLFEVVSLRNYAVATISSDEERKELATMNLQAALKASEIAAFDAAAVYFKAGRELMGEDGWANDQKMMIQLCSEGANACFISNDLDTMHKLIDEVINKDILVDEKFRAYEIKALAAQGEGKFGESLTLCLEVRRQLGLPAFKNKPTSTLIVLKEFIKTKRALKGMTTEDVANLPSLTDERVIKGQRLLELMSTSSFMTQPTVYPLVCFLLVNTSLKFGINSSSCDGFAIYAFLLCGAFGDPQRGREMANAVDLILEKPDMERMKSRANVHNHGMSFPHSSPLHGCLAPLLEGYQWGLESGDTESSMYNLMFRSWFIVYVGRPLDSVEQELQANCDLMVYTNQLSIKYWVLPYLLLAKKLRGVEIDEDEKDFESLEKHCLEMKMFPHRATAIIVQLELLVFLSSWEDAAKKLGMEDLRQFVSGLYQSIRYTFLEALILLKRAQSVKSFVKKRKLKKRALKPIKILRGWAKKGNMNVVHYVHLVEAQLAALEGKNNKAEEKYKLAIASATRNGFIQDRALMHELASEHFSITKNNYWKDYHFDSAIKSYTDWGASIKVAQLESKRESN